MLVSCAIEVVKHFIKAKGCGVVWCGVSVMTLNKLCAPILGFPIKVS